MSHWFRAEGGGSLGSAGEIPGLAESMNKK